MSRDCSIRVLCALLIGLVPCGCGSRKTIVVGSDGALASDDYQLDLVKPESPKSQPDSVGMVFCLDVSGSMKEKIGGRPKIDISKEAMRSVFNQIDDYIRDHPNKTVRVGLCTFDSNAKIIEALGPFNREHLEARLTPLRANGGTAIGEAIALAMKTLAESGADTRAIVVMTDGENRNGVSPDRVVNAIKKNRNGQGLTTADTEIFLVAFDVDAKAFDGVKRAGAIVKESKDQASLQSILRTLVDEVLLEKPD